jgi:hypothetical protein
MRWVACDNNSKKVPDPFSGLLILDRLCEVYYFLIEVL